MIDKNYFNFSLSTNMTPRKLMDADAEDKQKQDGEGIIKESSVQLRSDPKIKGKSFF